MGKGICAAGTQTCTADGSGFGPCVGETLPAPLEDCATLEDDDCSGQATCGGAALWSKAWGSAYTDLGQRAVTDASDNVYVAGWIGGPVDFGGGLRTPPNPGAPDISLVKYDAAGSYAWDRVFHATSGFSPYGLDLYADAAGALYLTGGFVASLDLGGGCKLDNGNNFAPTAFVAKLTASGACVFAKKFGDGIQTHYGVSVRVSAAGELLFIGEFLDTITIGPTTLASQGQVDAFVAKLDAAGSPMWAKSFGGPADDHVDAVFDAEGGVIIYGGFQGGALLDGESKTSAGSYDLFISRYAPNGGKLWLKAAGDALYQVPGKVLVDPNSNDIVLTGSFLGSFNFGAPLTGNDPFQTMFALKLKSDGSFLWGKSFPGGQDELTNARLDPLGNLVFIGTSSGRTDFGGGPLPDLGGYSTVVVKLDPQGGHIFSHAYGTKGNSLPIGLAIDTHGNTILTGEFAASIDFGSGEHVATPGADPCPLPFFACDDAFLAKLGP